MGNLAEQSGSFTTQIKESTVSTNLLYAAQNLIRTYVIDAYSAWVNGRTRFFDTHNINPKLVAQLKPLAPSDMDELCLNYARMVLAKPNPQSGQLIDINKILQTIIDRNDEADLADRFLLAGASNTLMMEYFGKRSKECSNSRSRLGLSLGRGRKADPKNEDHLLTEIYEKYELAMNDTRCPRQSLLRVYEETGHYIDYIHRVIKKNRELAL